MLASQLGTPLAGEGNRFLANSGTFVGQSNSSSDSQRAPGPSKSFLRLAAHPSTLYCLTVACRLESRYVQLCRPTSACPSAILARASQLLVHVLHVTTTRAHLASRASVVRPVPVYVPQAYPRAAYPRSAPHPLRGLCTFPACPTAPACLTQALSLGLPTPANCVIPG